jgi:hypothetical protein
MDPATRILLTLDRHVSGPGWRGLADEAQLMPRR